MRTQKMITVVPATSEPQIVMAVRAALSVHEKQPVARNVVQEQANSSREPQSPFQGDKRQESVLKSTKLMP